MRSRDAVWTLLIRVDARQKYVCSHCETALSSNPASVKKHIVSSGFRGIEDTKRMLLGILAGPSKGSGGCATETGDRRAETSHMHSETRRHRQTAESSLGRLWGFRRRV